MQKKFFLSLALLITFFINFALQTDLQSLGWGEWGGFADILTKAFITLNSWRFEILAKFHIKVKDQAAIDARGM